MKIKTSELIGPALDWAVAKLWYSDRRVELTEGRTGVRVLRDPSYDGSEHYHWFGFIGSTDWSQGGPIIEREGIATAPLTECWEAQIEPDCNYPRPKVSYGPTPLIAAMRCYVASKLGDEVEVPDELLK